MGVRRNVIPNPNFEKNLNNWAHSNAAWGVLCAQAPIPSGYQTFFASKYGMDTSWTGLQATNGFYYGHNFEALKVDTPAHAEMKTLGLEGVTPIRIGFEIFSNGQRTNTAYGALVDVTPGKTTLHTLDVVLPAGTDRVVMIFYRANKTDVTTRLIASDALLEIGTSGDYFDGSRAYSGGYAYGWEGEPNKSASYRVDTVDRVHPWTWSWWKFLPEAYRGDRYQNPEIGGYPMLRFMEGAGRIAGEVRDLTDRIFDGRFMNPATTPASALPWLAQLMGTDELGRQKPPEALRSFLVDMSAEGRVAVGTRAHIQHAAKTFLQGERRVVVVPSPENPHRLILLLAEADTPGLDIPAFMAKLRASGVVPAGHEIVVSLAVSTWDDWETAAGISWDDLAKKAKTWAESDALGVVLK